MSIIEFKRKSSDNFTPKRNDGNIGLNATYDRTRQRLENIDAFVVRCELWNHKIVRQRDEGVSKEKGNGWEGTRYLEEIEIENAKESFCGDDDFTRLFDLSKKKYDFEHSGFHSLC